MRLPVAPALEAAFIASCFQLANAHAGRDVLRIVSDDCFTRPLWRESWQHIAAAWEDGAEADVVVTAHKIAEKRGADPKVILARMLEPEAAYPVWEGYALERAKALRDYATRRALVELGYTAQEAAAEDDLPGVVAYTLAAAEILDKQTADEESGDLTDVGREVEERAERGDAKGIQTGIYAYDDWTGGLRRGTVHVVTGNTGAGKTMFLGQVMQELIDQGVPCVFFSLEMSRREFWIRMLYQRIGMLANRLKGTGPKWTADELARYQSERDALYRAFDAGTVRVFCGQHSAAQVAKAVRQHRPRVFMVDYLQLMDRPRGAVSEYDAVTENATAMQQLAMRTDCTAMLASQLSLVSVREGASSAVISGAGSGRIGQVANFFLHIATEDGGRMRLYNRKNRDGPSGDDALYELDRNGRLMPV